MFRNVCKSSPASAPKRKFARACEKKTGRNPCKCARPSAHLRTFRCPSAAVVVLFLCFANARVLCVFFRFFRVDIGAVFAPAPTALGEGISPRAMRRAVEERGRSPERAGNEDDALASAAAFRSFSNECRLYWPGVCASHVDLAEGLSQQLRPFTSSD